MAGIPDRRAIRRRYRLVLQVLAAGDHRVDHLVAGHRGDREAWLVLRPQPEREGQLHLAVELRGDRQPGGSQVRVGLADEGGYPHVGRLVGVVETVAGRQRAVVHVQRLRVAGEDLRIQPDRIEPAATGVVVDLAPAGDRRGARDVALGVIHERDHVAHVRLGAARRGHRGEVAVGQIAGEIAAEIGSGAGQQEARVGLAERGQGCAGGEQAQAGEQGMADFHAGSRDCKACPGSGATSIWQQGRCRAGSPHPRDRSRA